MKACNNRDDVYEFIAGIKTSSECYLTNFYPNDAKLDHWTEKGVFYSRNLEHTVFFFRRDRDFYHLSFCSTNGDTLRTSLREVCESSPDILVVDLPGQEANLKQLVGLFEQSGFHKYAQYCRLSRLVGRDEALPTVGGDIVFPEIAEAKTISGMLEDAFDHYAEQLPTVDEIVLSIRSNAITVVREQGSIVGILMRDMAKYSSLWRFFLVSEGWRGKGVGSRLLNYYFHECRGKRVTSWVLDINANSLELHKHCGFAVDPLRDQILINRDNMFCKKNY